MTATLTLEQSPIKETVTIHQLDNTVPFSKRLAELGFLPGAPVTLVHKSPFDGPLTFQIRGTKVALRRQDAACVTVSYDTQHVS